MQFSLALSVLASAALFVLPTLAQTSSTSLCSQAPPPSCLYDCIQETGECNMCTTEGAAAVLACAQNTCGPPPYGANPYADGVYLPCICPNGGFIDYSTTPQHFEVIPPADCY